VNDSAIRVPRIYEISIDRAGMALGIGSVLAGGIVLGLLLLGGTRNPIALASGWVIGSIFSGLAMTAVGGPLWLVMHVAGLRRARHAALIGAVVALAVFTGAQTYGFGLFEMPPMDSRTWLFRWLSAIASSAVLGIIAAAIGVVMWRIAYRQQRED
jgi:hypothetical protein